MNEMNMILIKDIDDYGYDGLKTYQMNRDG